MYRYILNEEGKARREMRKHGYPDFQEMLMAIKMQGKLPEDKMTQIIEYFKNKHKNKMQRNIRTVAAAMALLLVFAAIAYLPQSRVIATNFWNHCMTFVRNQLMVIYRDDTEKEGYDVPNTPQIDEKENNDADIVSEESSNEFETIDELQRFINGRVIALDPIFAKPLCITYRGKGDGRCTITIRYETENYGEIMIKQIYDENRRNLGIEEEKSFVVNVQSLGIELIGEISDQDGWFAAYGFVDEFLLGIGVENGNLYKEIISYLISYETK